MEKTISVISNAILLLMILPAILIWIIWSKTSLKKRIKWLGAVIIVGLALSLLFWVARNLDRQIGRDQVELLGEKIESLEGELEAERHKNAELSRLLEKEKESRSENASAGSLSAGSDTMMVSRVIDGDTIELANGATIRYIGINTPEIKGPKSKEQCFGNEATEENRKLVEGKSVVLVKDISETDKYQRLLRYVYVGDVFVNDHLVRNGFAYASSYPPDVRYRDQFREAQSEARLEKRGLWAQNACSR